MLHRLVGGFPKNLGVLKPGPSAPNCPASGSSRVHFAAAGRLLHAAGRGTSADRCRFRLRVVEVGQRVKMVGTPKWPLLKLGTW